MANKIEITNAALIAVGSDIIASLSDQTTEAQVVNTIWDQARRSLLRANLWNFATKRVELAQSVTPPSFDYAYRYALPSDHIRTVQVFTDTDYKVENGFVVTNSERCQLKYIADIVDVNLWASDFCEVMSAKLAAEIAFPLTKDLKVSQLMYSLFQEKLQAAIWIDASEDIADNYQFDNSLLIGRQT